jgi:hypothetical protein
MHDHGTVVALDEIVRRLVKAECRRSDDPDAQLQEWAAWLKGRAKLYTDFGFGEGQTPDTRLNAVDVSVAFDTFAENLLAPES